jgi:hypothetical protein
VATRAPREYICFTATTSRECNESYSYCYSYVQLPLLPTTLYVARGDVPPTTPPASSGRERARRVGTALPRGLCEARPGLASALMGGTGWPVVVVHDVATT